MEQELTLPTAKEALAQSEINNDIIGKNVVSTYIKNITSLILENIKKGLTRVSADISCDSHSHYLFETKSGNKLDYILTNSGEEVKTHFESLNYMIIICPSAIHIYWDKDYTKK